MKKSNHLLHCFASKEKNIQPTFITSAENVIMSDVT